MGWLLVKYLSTAGIVVLVSEVAKRSDKLGALIAALPLVTILALIWLQIETGSQEKVANHAWYTFCVRRTHPADVPDLPASARAYRLLADPACQRRHHGDVLLAVHLRRPLRRGGADAVRACLDAQGRLSGNPAVGIRSHDDPVPAQGLGTVEPFVRASS